MDSGKNKRKSSGLAKRSYFCGKFHRTAHGIWMEWFWDKYSLLFPLPSPHFNEILYIFYFILQSENDVKDIFIYIIIENVYSSCMLYFELKVHWNGQKGQIRLVWNIFRKSLLKEKY